MIKQTTCLEKNTDLLFLNGREIWGYIRPEIRHSKQREIIAEFTLKVTQFKCTTCASLVRFNEHFEDPIWTRHLNLQWPFCW
jgi:hypothetical protein